MLGSQNSSNSQRLRELAGDAGIPAYLIDGADDIDPDWLAGVETILITAGRQRPETVVNQCIEWLKDRYEVVVEPVIVPRGKRQLSAAQSAAEVAGEVVQFNRQFASSI